MSTPLGVELVRGGAESFSALAARYHPDDGGPVQVSRVSLSAALNGLEDPMGVLAYLKDLGSPVGGLPDLLLINQLEDEELSAFPVLEGVAVSVASDGLWVLYEA